MEMKEREKQSEILDQNDIKIFTIWNKEPEYELWIPDRLNSALAELSKDDRNSIFFHRLVTSLLNKLTPENFASLSKKIIRLLPITTPARMQQVVEMIHTKAIHEWKYRSLYAKLCDLMQNVAVDELENMKSFRLHLIAYCETFFHRSLSEEFILDRKKYEISLCFDQEIKKLLVKEYEENEHEYLRKTVGNCQFIGELFKVYLIHPKIIFLILDQLLKRNGNMAVECVCALLTTIGSFYEEKINKLPAAYFNKLELLLPSGEISLRIRFMIQDVLDLKKNFWHPRKLLELPKTLQQIDQDMVEEKKNLKLKESMPRLDYILTKNKSNYSDEVCRKIECEWTEISNYYFNDIFEPRNRENRTESSISTSSTHSYEDSGLKIQDKLTSNNSNAEVPTESNLLSKNLKADELKYQENISAAESNEVFVLQQTKTDQIVFEFCPTTKYTVEFLKSLGELPQCRKSVELPDNLPRRFYPDKGPSKNLAQGRSDVFINDGRRCTSISIRKTKSNTIRSANQIRMSDLVGPTGGFKQWNFDEAEDKTDDNTIEQVDIVHLEDEWKGVEKSLKNNYKVDTSKFSALGCTKQTQISDSLDPTSGFKQWNSGMAANKAGDKKSVQNKYKQPPLFSWEKLVLSSGNRNKLSSSLMEKIELHPNEDAVEAGKILRSGSAPNIHPFSRKSSIPRQQMLTFSSTSSWQPMLSSDELKRAIVTIYEEYESNNDLGDSIDTFGERFNPKQRDEAVGEMMSYIIQNKPNSAVKFGILLANLIKRGYVTKKHFIDAGKFFYEFALADDLIIDCPNMWITLAEISNLLIRLKCLRIEDLQNEIPCKALLDYLKNSTKVPMNKNKILKKYLSSLKEDNFNDIIKWIDENYENSRNSPAMVSVLIKTICEIIDDEWQKEGKQADDSVAIEETFEKYEILLKFYIENRSDLEMQCLLTVHKYVSKASYPRGLLCRIFELMYDRKVISYDSFMRWKNASTTSEIAVTQLKQFFDYLEDSFRGIW